MEKNKWSMEAHRTTPRLLDQVRAAIRVRHYSRRTEDTWEAMLIYIRHWRMVALMFTFIESSAFERVLPVYLDDDEYAELQQFMMQNSESGQVVPTRVRLGNYVGRGRVWANVAGCESSISYGTNRTNSGC